LLETVLVAVLGAALALGANSLSPRGLRLNRNYSPGGALVHSRSAPNDTNQTNGLESVEKQLAAEGLQLADNNRATRLFQDPARQQGLIIFVDARDDDHFSAGHIPGAFHLDHYHPENTLAQVLSACQAAREIVVYCKGGSCEDSEQTAIFLRDAGVARERLWVYVGGFDEWTAHHMPVETGDRNSGQLEKTVGGDVLNPK
jgi:thiosulfate sulfurtransferase